ncbi:GntR family transcriptional regulator [Desertimonas flava]|uniref:GntR family transcriptional regulator n=1 Tax=Desertimonas flava TaxID=2064846 RepID=UPI0013C4EAE3|nr:GntR family transcriptional regulator [Desertimonas flava]
MGANTRAHDVLSRLRSDILNGRLAPGTKLGFTEMGRRYQVSTGVLREVFTRLADQGLATSEAQLGFRVVDVSLPALSELTEARVFLERGLMRQAIDRGDVEWETLVVATHHTLSRTPMVLDGGETNPRWIEEHQAFHEALLSGAGNRYLFDIASRLRLISEVYRCWTRARRPESKRDVASEHRAIMESAIARDPDHCASLVEAHIRTTTALLVSTQAATIDA